MVQVFEKRSDTKNVDVSLFRDWGARMVLGVNCANILLATSDLRPVAKEWLASVTNDEIKNELEGLLHAKLPEDCDNIDVDFLLEQLPSVKLIRSKMLLKLVRKILDASADEEQRQELAEEVASKTRKLQKDLHFYSEWRPNFEADQNEISFKRKKRKPGATNMRNLALSQSSMGGSKTPSCSQLWWPLINTCRKSLRASGTDSRCWKRIAARQQF